LLRLINLATIINLLTHYAKGTPSFYFKTSTAYRITNSRLFHIVIQRTISTIPLQYFSLSLNLLYLALEDGSPIFRQVFSHRT
jgi:fumarate reductase subunit C